MRRLADHVDLFLTVVSVGLFLGALVMAAGLLLNPMTLLIPLPWFLLGGVGLTGLWAATWRK